MQTEAVGLGRRGGAGVVVVVAAGRQQQAAGEREHGEEGQEAES